ncbi:MAG: ferredoxin FdxA [Pontibacterium sp.]
MTYLVDDQCIRCKYTDCVDVCPADCFYEGESMLVIHPDECIDCGYCEPVCPAQAIRHEDETRTNFDWYAYNLAKAEIWPRIRDAKAPLADADAWLNNADKLAFIEP